MAVPLVQGTLRYAYINGPQQTRSPKSLGEGAVFAASVLPIVHACSASDASTIYVNMKVGGSSTSFTAVKTAFENNYACMGITCSEVGGYYDTDNSRYFPDATPCDTGSGGSGSFSTIAGYNTGSQVTDHVSNCFLFIF